MSKNSSLGISSSWSINDWPADVYPGSASRSRYMVRMHRGELLEAGALVRVGRDLVIIGDRYERWLQRQGSRVPDYKITANRGRR
jgi:hypothetical protein